MAALAGLEAKPLRVRFLEEPHPSPEPKMPNVTLWQCPYTVFVPGTGNHKAVGLRTRVCTLNSMGTMD